MSDENCYLYRLTPARPGMLVNPTAEEDLVVDEHFAYLQGLASRGVLVLAGRTETQEKSSTGIVIYYAPTDEEAREIMLADPAVKKGVMLAEFHSFRLALLNADNSVDDPLDYRD